MLAALRIRQQLLGDQWERKQIPAKGIWVLNFTRSVHNSNTMPGRKTIWKMIDEMDVWLQMFVLGFSFLFVSVSWYNRRLCQVHESFSTTFHQILEECHGHPADGGVVGLMLSELLYMLPGRVYFWYILINFHDNISKDSGDKHDLLLERRPGRTGDCLRWSPPSQRDDWDRLQQPINRRMDRYIYYYDCLEVWS